MNMSTSCLKAILISNDKYSDGLNNLSGANHITEKIYRHLVNTTSVASEDIALLQDKDHVEAYDAILKFINEIKHPDDTIFFFYFCGHGNVLSNDPKKLILATKDTSKANSDYVGIGFDALVTKVKQSNIKRFICVIDSCCSGVINTMGYDDVTQIEVEKLSEGYVYISSVSGTQSAYEVEFENNKVPLFSHCFYKALETLANGDDNFSIHDVFEQTKSLISKTQFKVNMNPTSKYSNLLFGEKIFHNFQCSKKCGDEHNTNIINTTTADNEFSQLDIIDWRITSECNNGCGVCYACNNGPDMEEKDIDIVIDKLSKFGCKSICISGGEPTKSKYFEKIISKLNESGFSIFLSTNGYKFMSYRDIIEDYIDKLSLPLDGYNAESNTKNGRGKDSFDCVKEILDFYKDNNHKFDIKISTVLTRKTCNIYHLEKIFNLLNEYNISMWKIYEFIPENRGLVNKNNFSLKRDKINEVQRWVNSVNNGNFRVELVKKKKRNAAYFIIQPNGNVIIPIEEKNGNVLEKKVGNILSDSIQDIENCWDKYVNIDNYYSNIKLRKINQTYVLDALDKKILYALLDGESIPSAKAISKKLKEDKKIIIRKLNTLYAHRIIKNIIPIVDLKLFGIKTFLVTLNFPQYANYPEEYLEEYLSYNAYTGWVIKCENNIYRIAIFAKEQVDARHVLETMRKDLNNEIKYDIHDLKCSFTIGEKKLFVEKNETLPLTIEKYNSSDKNILEDIQLTNEEYYILKQIEIVREPLKEYMNSKIPIKVSKGFNEIVRILKKKNIIERLMVVLDTRLLGYEWYIIILRIDDDKVDDLIEYLKVNFSGVTHINALNASSADWNLDFEVHVQSYSDVNNIISQIENEFDSIDIQKPLRIVQECKFSFLSEYVSKEIHDYHIINDETKQKKKQR